MTFCDDGVRYHRMFTGCNYNLFVHFDTTFMFNSILRGISNKRKIALKIRKSLIPDYKIVLFMRQVRIKFVHPDVPI